MRKAVGLSVLMLLGGMAGIALAQDKTDHSDLPTACEIRAYYLDKDYKPCDTADVKAVLVFETKKGKATSYPMTLTKPAEPSKAAPDCRWYDIEGSGYRVAVTGVCTYAHPPGPTQYDKPFLIPTAIPLEPAPKGEADKRGAHLAECSYFKVYLNRHALEDLNAGSYTEGYVQFTIRGDVKKMKTFSCCAGMPGGVCARITEDLKTLETQVQANDMAGAKTTMARVRADVGAIPAAAGTEKARADCSACCKDLDSAINAGDRDKALAHIRRLNAKCEECDELKAKEQQPDKKK